jgi:hypothetical protein
MLIFPVFPRPPKLPFSIKLSVPLTETVSRTLMFISPLFPVPETLLEICAKSLKKRFCAVKLIFPICPASLELMLLNI